VLTPLLLKGKVIFLIVTIIATSYSVFLLLVYSPLISATLTTTANFYLDDQHSTKNGEVEILLNSFLIHVPLANLLLAFL